MTDSPHEKAEALKRESPDIREALHQARPAAPAVAGEPVEQNRLYLGMACIAAALLLKALVYWRIITLPDDLNALVSRLAEGSVLAALVYTLGRVAHIYVSRHVEDDASRHSIRHVVDFVVFVLLGLIAVSVVFVNWYAAAGALGLLSIVLGFALQTPVSSFIGWTYILIRKPYRVGDRIKIGEATGDVIDVSYIDTTLWEFGGEYLSGDHPSGRIIKFPNSQVLSTMVWNYSWPLFPYIWDEIRFQIAYDSDLAFVHETMKRVAQEDRGEAMADRVKVFKELLAQTAVDQLDVDEHPVVLFRPNNNTWLDATVRYLVEPRHAGATKSRLVPKLLAALNAEPGKVKFPRSDAR
jgi:small-conductance mechanosensitive channel